MAVLNPSHLFEQADKLILSPSAGAPRQVDLRRAISAAYYGLFHFTLAAVANEFVGVINQATSRYALLYRSIDHKVLNNISVDALKAPPPGRYVPYIPPAGFGPHIRSFAAAVSDLQRKRHLADYDPLSKFRTSDAKSAVGIARVAVGRFEQAAEADRKAFLALLVCPPR